MTVCESCKHANYCEMVKNGYSDKVKSCRSYRKIEPLTNFQRITQTEETLAEFIYCLQESFDYYVGNGAKKISQYAMEDANNKNHVELIHGNRDFDELMEWLKQESNNEQPQTDDD